MKQGEAVEAYLLLHRDTGLFRHQVMATAVEAGQANRRLAASGSRLRFVPARLAGHARKEDRGRPVRS